MMESFITGAIGGLIGGIITFAVIMIDYKTDKKHRALDVFLVLLFVFMLVLIAYKLNDQGVA